MLKTYQFKTHCKGDSHSSKTANIILPGLMIKKGERPKFLTFIFIIKGKN